MSKFNILKNIAISAGAGTGKTYTLSRRYINILLGFNFFQEHYPTVNAIDLADAEIRRADPQQIVTITYTEAGAGEMRGRINQLISSILQHLDNETNEDQSITTALTHFVSLRGYIKNRLTQCKAKMIYANISTIHSFALNLLKNNADILKSDLSPIIISDTEKTTIFKTSLSNAFDKNESGTLELLISLGSFKLNKVAAKYIYDNKFRGYLENFVNSRLSGKDLLKAYQRIKTTEHLKELYTVIEGYIAVAPFAKNPEKYGAFKDYILEVARSFASFTPLEGRAPTIFQVTEGGKEVRDQFNQALKTVRGVPVALNEDTEKQFLDTLSLIHNILKDCYQGYLSAIIEAGYIDFDLIVSLAAENVENGKIKADYTYYMIDEFQDTNEMQWGMLHTLAKNTSANMFLVGDEKQSIYSFQGAEVEIFQKAVTESGADSIPMSDNRRSTAEILDFANRTFSPLFKKSDQLDIESVPDDFKYLVKELDKISLKGDTGLKYENLTFPKDSSKKSQTNITYLISKDTWTEDEDLAQDDVEYENIAKLLYKIKKGELKQYMDVTIAMQKGKKAVAILFNSRNGMSILKDKLDEYGISCLANFKENFYQAKEIFEIFHVLKLLSQLRKDTEWEYLKNFNLGGALRSSLIRISDDQLQQVFKEENIEVVHKIMGPYLKASQTLSIASLISFIISVSNLKTVYKFYDEYEQRIANLNKLVQIAITFEKEHFSDLQLFVKELENAIFFTDDTDESIAAFDAKGMDSVILTTIHASKGLQYPMVIMPQMTKNLTRAGSSDSFKFGKVLHPDMDPISMIGFKVKEKNPIAYTLASEISVKKDIEERKRLFYVALTRAEKHIVISIPQYEKAIKNTYLKFLSEQYKGNLLEKINSFADQKETEGAQPDSKTFNNVTLLKLKAESKPEAGHKKLPAIVPANIFDEVSLADTVDAVTTSLKTTNKISFSDANVVGTAFHELVTAGFDTIEDDTKVELLINRLLNKHQLPPEKFQKLQTMSQNFVKHPLYAEIKSADERYFEKDFNIKTDDGIKRGSIDLLYRKGDQWNIIDFKTNNLTGSTEAEITKKNSYDKQLEYYSAAVKSSLGIEVHKKELMYVNG